MKSIFLMPEYGCNPLWIDENGVRKNVETDSFALSSESKERIKSWDSQFQSTLDQEYPPDSGFDNKAEEVAFNNLGEQICEMIQRELGSLTVVKYVKPFE